MGPPCKDITYTQRAPTFLDRLHRGSLWFWHVNWVFILNWQMWKLNLCCSTLDHFCEKKPSLMRFFKKYDHFQIPIKHRSLGNLYFWWFQFALLSWKLKRSPLQKEIRNLEDHHFCWFHPLAFEGVSSAPETYRGGGFTYFSFSALLGEVIQFIRIFTNMFQMGWNHQPVNV